MDRPDTRFSFSPTHSRSKAVSLSLAVDRWPELVDECTIDLPNKHITVVDELPEEFRCVERLNLAENGISSVVALRTLVFLSELDLSYNSLASLTSLEPLFSLDALEQLDLRRNPVTAVSLYRSFTIYNLPSLTMLDLILIRSKEKYTSERQMKQFLGNARTIASNEESLLYLENLQKKLKIHRELIVTNRVQTYHTPDLSIILSAVKIADRESIESEVKEWVYTRFSLNDKKSAEIAWNECLAIQAAQINQLTEVCEGLIQECVLLTQSQSEFRSFDSALQLGQSPRKSLRNDSLEGQLESFRWSRSETSRVLLLDTHMTYLRTKSDHSIAIQNAIKEGLSVVVDSFRKAKLTCKALAVLKQGANERAKISEFQATHSLARARKAMHGILQNWGYWASIQSFNKRSIRNRRDQMLRLVIMGWTKQVKTTKLCNYQRNRKERRVLKAVFRELVKYYSLRHDHLRIGKQVTQRTIKNILRGCFQHWYLTFTQKHSSEQLQSVGSPSFEQSFVQNSRPSSKLHQFTRNRRKQILKKCFTQLKPQMQTAVTEPSAQPYSRLSNPRTFRGTLTTPRQSLVQRVEALESAVSSLMTQRKPSTPVTLPFGQPNRLSTKPLSQPLNPPTTAFRTTSKTASRTSSLHLISAIHQKLDHLETRLLRKCFH